MECNGLRVTSTNEKGFLRTGAEENGNDRENNQQLQHMQTLQGKDVDEAIQRERERDLRKINQDLAMVNEMFRYLLVKFSNVSL